MKDIIILIKILLIGAAMAPSMRVLRIPRERVAMGRWRIYSHHGHSLPTTHATTLKMLFQKVVADTQKAPQ